MMRILRPGQTLNQQKPPEASQWDSVKPLDSVRSVLVQPKDRTGSPREDNWTPIRHRMTTGNKRQTKTGQSINWEELKNHRPGVSGRLEEDGENLHL